MFRNTACATSARASLAIALGTAAFLLLSPVLFAAEQAKKDTPKTDDEELSEVQVTGTRIQSPNVTSANPITSISAEEMRRLGIVNVADVLTQLIPQNISTYMPTLTGDIQSSGDGGLGLVGGQGSGARDMDRGSFFIGNTIANLRGLDPQFGSRTLTLIDGRRVVSTSSQADVVDLNIIPSNLLERVDVVTGGASATYGSGAIAGVVNLVLNRRLNGVNLDMDYGINEAGDGGSPHISLSGGTSLFRDKGHVLFGAEWQKQQPIRDCAAARDWCAESRAMLSNVAPGNSLTNLAGTLIPLPGYGDINGDGIGDFPARFEVANVRYNQFSPNGVIYENNTSTDLSRPAPTSGYRFSAAPGDDGLFGIEEFPYGYRGAANNSTVINGDGPLATSGTTLRPSTDRKSLFSNFEYDFTSTTTGYLQTSYAATDNDNRNRYTTNTACVRFNTPGVAAVPGGKAVAGQTVYFGDGPVDQLLRVPDGIITNANNLPTYFSTHPQTRDGLFTNGNFLAFIDNPNVLPTPIGNPGTGQSPRPSSPANPFIIAATGYTLTNLPPPGTQPVYGNFSSNVASAHYTYVWGITSSTPYWLLDYIVLAAPFEDPGIPAILPTTGRNAYAFLNNLSSDALYRVEASNNRSSTAGTQNAATSALFGSSPCLGYTAIKKVWNPQIQQFTTQKSDTWRAVAGVRGRFGSDWKWDAYYQYGATDSTSRQYNAPTNLSFNFAMDAVIDDRQTTTVNGQSVPNPTLGQPVCRVTRDGVPQFDVNGFEISDPGGLAALAAGCKPLNIFGNGTAFPAFKAADGTVTLTSAQAAELQREAMDYAFKDSISDGANSLQTLSLSTNGTLWQGWAGPLTSAFGLEFGQNAVDNKGSRGPFYQRADLNTWGDAFGGKTRSSEGSIELNLPLVSGQDGLNMWTINTGARYTSYYNKGGAGTTGAHSTQNTLNWKFQTQFSPFDWVSFRLTRSRDLRAPGYRDLFLNQPSLPDQASGTNPWRDATDVSNENQTERWGFIRVGNPDLKPETGSTLTLGLVLRPGGWAQGMNFSADYSDTRVKRGIYTPYQFQDPIQSCWDNSGNSNDKDNPNYGLKLYDASRPECQRIRFALLDPNGPDDPSNYNLQDIVSYDATKPANGLPYQRRSLDLSWNYNFPLNRAFESLPGSMSLTLRGTRTLEASGLQQNCGTTTVVSGTNQCTDVLTRIDLVGQIRSSTFIPGVSASPKWVGNVSASYLYGNLTTTLSARYTGAAFIDNTWIDDPAEPGYYNANGQVTNATVDDNWVKPYVNMALNASYNLKIANLRQFQVFGSINNLFDKSPPFTGGGISGASAGYADTLGRAYRMGVRVRF